MKHAYPTDYSDISSYLKEMDIDYAQNEKAMHLLGIREENGAFRSSNKVGMIGVKNRSGKTVPLVIRPRFASVQPLVMLEALTRDRDFLVYAETKPSNKEPLYEIFHHMPLIKAPSSGEGETLTAISYVMRLYDVCKRQLKPQMSQVEQNLYGKVKGKILFKQHLRNNVMTGQEHRVYCRYHLHTVDNIENRILKTALLAARRIIHRFYSFQGSAMGSLASQIAYCEHALRDVRQVNVSKRDFATVRTTGFYSFYKPVLTLAQLLLTESHLSMSDDQIETETIPFSIDMQKLFEAYLYSKLKKVVQKMNESKGSPYHIKLNRYQESYPLIGEKKAHRRFPLIEEGRKRWHLQNQVIPDFYLEITDNRDGTVKRIVLDAKYKHADVYNRIDTLQIFAYAYLFQADAIGFIFPHEEDRTNVGLQIGDGPDLYFEFFMKLGNEEQENQGIDGVIPFLTSYLFS